MALYTALHPTTYVGYDTDPFDDDQDIDALIQGYAWNMTDTNVLAFSFVRYSQEITHANSGASNAAEFTETWKAQQRLALLEFSKAVDIIFEEQAPPSSVADAINNGSDGVLRFATASGLDTAFGYYPSFTEAGGDTTFNYSNFEPDAHVGTYTFVTMMHETGHNMGLAHGNDDEYGGEMTDARDSMEYSVMTYNSHAGPSPDFYTNAPGHYAQTLMMYDIAALHRLYGADYGAQSGDTTYTFDTTTGEMFIDGVGQGRARTDSNANANVLFRTVWDGNGKDTYDFSNFTTDLIADLTPGAYSDLDVGGTALRAQLNQGWNASGTFIGTPEEVFARGHLFNALMADDDKRSLIERAVAGSGDDVMTGNDANNRLVGGTGTDLIMGGRGRDDLRGGKDSDTIEGGDGGDFLRGGKNRDIIEGGNGTDKISGNKGRDIITGGRGDDEMTGNAGADKFKFAKRAGDDVITDFELAFDTLVIDIDNSANPLTTSNVNGALVIDFGYGDTITLEGLAGTDIGNIDIVFT